jgi:hypothetical protein
VPGIGPMRESLTGSASFSTGYAEAVGSSASRRPPKRRNKVRRLPRTGGHIDPSAFGTEHSAYTIEGQIESVGLFARGASRASAAQWRFVGRLFIGFVGVLVAIATLTWLVARFA